MRQQFGRCGASLALALASCTFVAASVRSEGTLPPSPEELQSSAAQQEEAGRLYVSEIEKRFLSTTRDEGRDADFEKQIRTSITKDLGHADAIGSVECRGQMCKIVIRLTKVPDVGSVIFAVTHSHRCAIPLLNIPNAADKTVASAYIACATSPSSLK